MLERGIVKVNGWRIMAQVVCIYLLVRIRLNEAAFKRHLVVHPRSQIEGEC